MLSRQTPFTAAYIAELCRVKGSSGDVHTLLQAHATLWLSCAAVHLALLCNVQAIVVASRKQAWHAALTNTDTQRPEKIVLNRLSSHQGLLSLQGWAHIIAGLLLLCRLAKVNVGLRLLLLQLLLRLVQQLQRVRIPATGHPQVHVCCKDLPRLCSAIC